MSLYLSLQFSLVVSRVLFQLLPKKRLSARAVKVLAQGTLVLSLVAVPFFALWPKSLFPKLPVTPVALQGVDMDGANAPSSTVQTIRWQLVTGLSGVQAESENSSWSLWIVVLSMGMVLMLAHRLWAWSKLWRHLGKSYALHHIGRVSVMISDTIAVPFSVLFLSRAYIVLPVELVPRRDDFKIALKHEAEHHRRGDTLWAVILELLICVFYLNPAIYLWRKTILQWQELACDEALISRMGISQQDYGSCLCEWQRWRLIVGS